MTFPTSKIINRFFSIIILLDFSSAFHFVEYDILLSILHSINPIAIVWFSDYLRYGYQRIRYTDSYSAWFTLASGVPLGDVFSTLLFLLFTNVLYFICRQIICKTIDILLKLIPSLPFRLLRKNLV